MLYLDADQLLFGDIYELYNSYMEDKPLGMVAHCNNTFSMFVHNNHWTNHLQARGLEYMFAGMGLYDLEILRKMNGVQTYRKIYNNLMS